MTFDLPANGLYVKINDFGMNQISASFLKNHSMNYKIVDNPYRDYFSILYDVYNGANFGGISLMYWIQNKKKQKKIDTYFNHFMDIQQIKTIIKNEHKERLDWDWNKTHDKKVVKLLGLKKFNDYLKHFISIFPYDKEHVIVEEYGPRF
jgi:hypothetical protein